jgi:hypothetical protein
LAPAPTKAKEKFEKFLLRNHIHFDLAKNILFLYCP